MGYLVHICALPDLTGDGDLKVPVPSAHRSVRVWPMALGRLQASRLRSSHRGRWHLSWHPRRKRGKVGMETVSLSWHVSSVFLHFPFFNCLF